MNQTASALSICLAFLACGATPPAATAGSAVVLGQGMIAGEVTQDGVTLQARLTAPVDPAPAIADVPGRAGALRFEIAQDAALTAPRTTEWMRPGEDQDYIARVRVDGLEPGTRYHYAARFGPDAEHARRGPIGTFVTLPAPDQVAPVHLAIVTCFTYFAFHHGRKGQKRDIADGYPALEALAKGRPDYLFLTGDNVYYDAPVATRAKTRPEMRAHWHREHSKPRLQRLLAQVGSYWQKDDHDYRYDDADNTSRPGREAPSPALGLAVFREQAPGPPADQPSYRTHRVGKLLQVWLTEGREHRSPNAAPDGPDKTLWGAAQKAWLMASLKASDAPIKLIISPTPLVGPDDAQKRDNHTNPKGFRHEGQAFLDWLAANFAPSEVTIIAGDRHWRYHSIDPRGIEEFSCGPICDAGARGGRAPGDPKSTDPEGKIRQPFTADRRNGGYLTADVVAEGAEAVLTITFHDKRGKVLYEQVRRRPLPR